MLDEAVKSYLRCPGSLAKLFEDIDLGQRELGVAPLSEDETMRLAVEEQHAWRLHRWAGGAFQVVVSAEILFELQEVLTPGLNSAAT